MSHVVNDLLAGWRRKAATKQRITTTGSRAKVRFGVGWALLGTALIAASYADRANTSLNGTALRSKKDHGRALNRKTANYRSTNSGAAISALGTQPIGHTRAGLVSLGSGGFTSIKERSATFKLATPVPNVPAAAQASGADLYIQDDVSDNGTEPNGTPLIYLSPDIWVSQTPMVGYSNLPFTPSTWVSPPGQNALWRDPLLSRPNYIYVRVTNRSTATADSVATDQLKIYWTSATTTSPWPSAWVDNVRTIGSQDVLAGAEITKVRKNAADATPQERADYIQAIIDIATLPKFKLDFDTLLSATHSYWTKQAQLHRWGPSNRHFNEVFLPWHRELINRYEILLQMANPKVKLLFWNWTEDPTNCASIAGGFIDLCTSIFMGASGRGTAVGPGSPLFPACAAFLYPGDLLPLPPPGPPGPVLRNLAMGIANVQPDTYAQGRFVNADTRAAATSDTTVTVNGSSANVEVGTRNVQSQIQIRPAGPVFTNTWRSFVDQTVWAIG